MPSNQLEALLECDCGCDGGACTCGGRCLPLYVDTTVDPAVERPGNCANPLPVFLRCDFLVTSSIEGDTCFVAATGTLEFKTGLSGGDECWQGTLSGSCIDCLGATMEWEYQIKVCCVEFGGGAFRWQVALVRINGVCPAETLSTFAEAVTCDPFLLQGCFPTFGACTPACSADIDPLPSALYDICFDIYEEP